MPVQHAERGAGAAFEEADHVGVALLGRDEFGQEPPGRVIGGQLVVVPQDPAHHLAALVGVPWAEAAEILGQIVQDHA